MLRSLPIILALITTAPAFAQTGPLQAPVLVLQPAFPGPQLTTTMPLAAATRGDAAPPSFWRALGGAYLGLGVSALTGLALFTIGAKACEDDFGGSCTSGFLTASVTVPPILAPFLASAGTSLVGGDGGGEGYAGALVGALLGTGLTVGTAWLGIGGVLDTVTAVGVGIALGALATPLLTVLGYLLGATIRDAPSIAPVLDLGPQGGVVGVRGAF